MRGSIVVIGVGWATSSASKKRATLSHRNVPLQAAPKYIGPVKTGGGFLRSASLDRAGIADPSAYPYSIPAVSKLDVLQFHPNVTFLIGENGSGKSTLIEAIAVAARFNAEGGSKATRFETARSESDLHRHLRLVRNTTRERD